MIDVLLASLPGRLLLVTEAQQTERAITALIALLLVVAAMLAVLTVWYWRHTSPRRKARHVFSEIDDGSFQTGYELELDRTLFDGEGLIDLGATYQDAGHQNYR